MPTQDDINGQQELLALHRRNLALLLRQEVLQGSAYVQPGVINGIYEARAHIRQIKEVLRSWGIPVEDHPGDEMPEQVAGSPAAASALPAAGLSDGAAPGGAGAPPGVGAAPAGQVAKISLTNTARHEGFNFRANDDVHLYIGPGSTKMFELAPKFYVMGVSFTYRRGGQRTTRTYSGKSEDLFITIEPRSYDLVCGFVRERSWGEVVFDIVLGLSTEHQRLYLRERGT